MCGIIFVSPEKNLKFTDFLSRRVTESKKKSGTLLLHMECTVQSGSFFDECSFFGRK